MKPRFLAASLPLGALAMLAGCKMVYLADFEADDAPACYIDFGAWAGEGKVADYAGESFHQLDEAMPGFIAALEQASRAGASSSAEDLTELHLEAARLIPQLGRLLPRMERALDLAPMISQMEDGQIWWPRGGHRTEFLRVAIAEEVVDHQNSSEHMARFLKNFSEAEALLLDLKTGGGSPEKRQRLHAIANGLPDDWQAAAFGFRRVIFDRPDMPEGESFSERMQARVMRYCDSYLECSGPAGTECDSGAPPTTPADPDDPLANEPMAEEPMAEEPMAEEP